MALYTKNILSGSTDGKGVLVVQTATLGTTIHTGPTTVAHLHEVFLYCMNSDTTARKLTIEWGAVAAKDLFELTIQPESGLVLVVPGLLLKGNATPLVVTAFAATANVLSIHGYYHLIS